MRALADEASVVGVGGLEQHVGGFEIAVHDAQAVQVLHARGHVQQGSHDRRLTMRQASRRATGQCML